jgi:hypothetical protein
MQNNEVAMTEHPPARYIVITTKWIFMNFGCAIKIAGGIIAINIGSM